ncbi:ABC transporter substrate-binding protein [Leptospira sp. 96542]|nr:ABC transporter substrate-binding protein [Leptospira sp. 96542]
MVIPRRIGIFAVLIYFISFYSLHAVEKVTLHLKWYHQFQFAGYYAAYEKGYYKDAGLDVDIFESTVGIVGIHDKVIASEGQYGVGSNELILERYAGKPVVVLGVIFQHSPSVLFIRKTSNTQSIHDLVGKRIMFTPMMDEIKAYVKKEGINLKDMTVLEHHFNPDDLISGRVDAYSGYISTQGYDFMKAKLPVIVYSPRVAGIDFYGDNLFTSEQELKNHPDRVKAFREASMKGWQYAMTNKEEIVDLILTKYSNRYSKERLLYEADQMMPLIQPVLVEIGYMNPGRWKHIGNVYFDLGMLPENVNLKGFLYDPNPEPDYTLLYEVLGILFGFIGVIWLVQWRRLNQKYADDLKLQVEIRTDELKKSNVSLLSLNENLSKTLSELTEAQDRLLASEKMATLGRLAAGMAHELNTPLGAIVASNQSLFYFLNYDFISFANQIWNLETDDKIRFKIILDESKKDMELLDGKSERKIQKDLKNLQIDGTKYNLTDKQIQLLIETGSYRLTNDLPFVLKTESLEKILSLVSLIVNAYRSSSIISLASEKASHVINDLRSYLVSEEEGGEGLIAIDVIHEIETLLALYHHNLSNKVTIIKTYLSEGKCNGNRDKLNQVWINLLNNALHAMSYQGSLEIMIEDKDEWLLVSFIDSGTGIPPSVQDKIFEPFFTTKPENEGMGLGLNLCRKVIQRMGGKIDFETKPGRTCFRVWLERVYEKNIKSV